MAGLNKMRISRLVAWNTTPKEHMAAYPSDAYVPLPRCRLTRAVNVQAPADVTFRWICQLKLAPYSYDWIDNLVVATSPQSSRIIVCIDLPTRSWLDRLRFSGPVPVFAAADLFMMRRQLYNLKCYAERDTHAAE